MDCDFFIGTSGWAYDDWKGLFYPEDLSSDELLPFYAQNFGTVEINNTFYQLPEKEVVRAWRDKVPNDFLFAVKANRYITHMKNLKDAEKPVERLIDTVSLLEDKLGPILFQLPPRWHVDLKRLKNFTKTLPDGYTYVFEVRHPTWYQEEVYEILSQINAALCIQDISGEMSPIKDLADFIYVRFHGPEGTYQGRYPKGVI